jgi:4-amino-4-deoxy-L-arabinose transferase-like glycosyltransferase
VTSAGQAPGGGWRERIEAWHLWLAGIVAVGLAIRLGYTIWWAVPDRLGDAAYYHGAANLLADGRGFLHPLLLGWESREVPGADHPPAYIVYLAAGSRLGLRTYLEHQVWSCFMGAATVALMGFAGRRIGGNRAGLVAAGLAAVFPNLWMPDGWVMSETMAIFATVVVIIAAYRCWDDPRPRRFALLGAAVGLAALSRSELLLLGPLVALPLFWFRRDRASRPVASLVLAGTAAVLVIAPWSLYNMSRFDDRVLLSRQGPLTMSAGWCDTGFYGPSMGYKSYECIAEAISGAPRDEHAEFAAEAWRSYAEDHLGRVPAVMLARIGRVWGFFRPDQQVYLETWADTSPEEPPTWLAFAMTWVMLPVAPVGAWRLRQRGTPLFPLMAPIVTVTAGVALTFGQLRYRFPGDPALILLVAGLVADRTQAPVDDQPGEVLVDEPEPSIDRPPVPALTEATAVDASPGLV